MSTTPSTQRGGAAASVRWVLAAAAALLPVVPALGADLEAGKRKVTEVCQACHGMDGNSPIPDNPKLGGQYRDYLAKSLRDYKSGARKNPVMQGMAGTLTPQDIDNIAAYYSSQPAVVESRW